MDTRGWFDEDGLSYSEDDFDPYIDDEDEENNF